MKMCENKGETSLNNKVRDVVEDPEKDLGLNQFQSKVYNIIKPFNTQPGCPLDTILNQFSTRQHADVKNAIKFLLDEGHIYSTHDDWHYLVTYTN